jgi:hypothetical protein
MFLALTGALSALLLLARWHDRQLARLPSRVQPASVSAA